VQPQQEFSREDAKQAIDAPCYGQMRNAQTAVGLWVRPEKKIMNPRATPLWIFLLIVAACSPDYRNQQENDLRLPLENRTTNTNPQTESFLQPILMPSLDERPKAKPIGGRRLSPNGYFVGLAISGGGSRSANFAAACMFELQRIGFLQKVQCISSVSGGSLAAAYYCSCKDYQWNPPNVQDKLTNQFETTLFDRVFFLPWNLFGLLMGTVNRSDMLADEFANAMFTRNGKWLTFADLRTDRPRLLINSTDMQSGRPFLFDNAYFDMINSRLDSYPLASAVVASSAVPALLDPTTLRDYSTSFDQYLHLVDGGVVDNLGVQTLVNSYLAESQQPIDPYPNGAIIVVIDAGTPSNAKINAKAQLGGIENLLEGFSVSSSVLLNRTGSATLSEAVVNNALGSYTAAELRGFIDTLQREHYLEIKDQGGRLVRIAHLSLSQVGELSTLTFGSSVNTISTRFDMTPGDAFNLYRAAQLLFQQRFDAKLKPLVEMLQNAQK
jgi:predicted acylesterase/phospholipase RssA